VSGMQVSAAIAAVIAFVVAALAFVGLRRHGTEPTPEVASAPATTGAPGAEPAEVQCSCC
jgi:hypothetical protein